MFKVDPLTSKVILDIVRYRLQNLTQTIKKSF